MVAIEKAQHKEESTKKNFDEYDPIIYKNFKPKSFKKLTLIVDFNTHQGILNSIASIL